MKDPRVLFSDRVVTTVALAALILFSAGLSAQESHRATVISMSPRGTSSLSWKNPTASPQEAVESLTLTLPEKEVTVEIEEPAASPIRPVRLLQVADQDPVTQVPPVTNAQNDVLPPVPGLTAAPTSTPALTETPAPAAFPTEEGNVHVVQKATANQDGDLGTVRQLATPRPNPLGDREQTATPGRNDTAYTDECPDPKSLSSILELSYKVVPQPGVFPENCPLPDEYYTRKMPTPITYTWKASALCHKPLYFEDVQLERYGHTVCPFFQPAISGARFWLTIPILPYLMGTYPPNECVYDLGYYRPGNCAPHMLDPLPISLRGGLWQAGTTVGLIYLIP